MSDVPQWDLNPVDEYLEGELTSDVRHEYINGVVHAMAGSRNAHNIIAGNILARTHSRLSGTPCLPFNSDTKVRIQRRNDIRFYYPDAMVVCERFILSGIEENLHLPTLDITIPFGGIYERLGFTE